MTGLISSVSKKFSSDKNAESTTTAPPRNDEPNADPAIDGLPGAGSGFGRSVLQNPKFMGIGAAGVIIVAGALFWVMSGSDEPVAQPQKAVTTQPVAETDVVFDEVPVAAETTNVDAMIDAARLARDAGQIFNPAGSNAIELFASALAVDPDNSIVAAELKTVVGEALRLAESAMLEARLDDTNAALQRVTAVDPQNARLPFLKAQLAQMQLRGSLDTARTAIRENRFEDATAALGIARGLDVPDSSEIDAVAAEISNARSEQQIDDVLGKAAARLDAGDLLSPANDNARYYYELVLSNDSENTAAQQGLSVIAGKLAFLARTEIDSGDLNAAEGLLADAVAIDSANSEVESTVTALANTRAAIAQQERSAKAARQAATEQRAADERAAAAARQAEADQQAEAERLDGEQQAATDAEEPVTDITVPEVTNGEIDTADTNAGVEKSSSQLSSSEPARQAEKPVIQQPAAVSSLSRTKYVAPKYPRSAQRRNLSGWVDVVFTVTTDGSVKNIDVRNSEPGDTFVNAATKAVEKWEFEPVFENGAPIEKLVGVRMMFALE